MSARSTPAPCTQNRHNPDHEFSDASQPHGTGFLVGKVCGIRRTAEQSVDGKQRWLIAISEYARINIPGAWDHGRNPVRYSSLAELKVNPNELKFEPVPQPGATLPTSAGPSVMRLGGLTIAEARKALAATFGVKPEAIEITIRG